MTVTVESFRQNFPEFADSTAYPDSGITFYLNLAVGIPGTSPNSWEVFPILNPIRWRTQLDLATQLYIAHHVVLEKQASDAAAVGGNPGTATGPLTSKSVSSVAASYDPNVAKEENAGYWNLTVYGLRLYRLIRLFGMGPLQIGVGHAPYPTWGWNQFGVGA